MMRFSSIGTKLCVHWIIFMSGLGSVFASLQDSMSPKRQAEARLYADVLNHTAVAKRLSPEDKDGFVKITFNVWPYTILAMEEIQQSVTSVSFVNISWVDPDLAWSSSDYEGIKEIFMSVSADHIWCPYFLVTNAANPDYMAIPIESVLLTATGTFTASVPIYLETTCDLDHTYYPFDIQECELIFLATRIPLVNIHAAIVEMPPAFSLTGEWTIESRDLILDSYRGALKGMLRVKLKLKRRRLYYIMCLLAPMTITSFMTSLVFWIPPGSGEKISFLVSVFVSNAVFLNIIAATMPRNMSDVPRITLFLLSVIIECFLAMVATLFVMCKYEQEQKEEGKELQLHETNPESSEANSEVSIPDQTPTNTWASKRDNSDTTSPTEAWQEGQRELIECESGLLAKFRQLTHTLRGMRAATWDVIFWVSFQLITLPWYALVIHSFFAAS